MKRKLAYILIISMLLLSGCKKVESVNDNNKDTSMFVEIEQTGMWKIVYHNADLSGEIVFCNPPYGRQTTGAFVKKCAEAANCLSVMLIPARTDTKWFHEYIYIKNRIFGL